jgi:uncharacterized protein with FMN-binding domain
MKRIPRGRSARRAAVGAPLVGVALVGILAGCASTTSAGATTASYKDGTYSADGAYSSPDGQEEIAVTVTVKNDVVTAVNVTAVESNGQGARYQAQFESGISSIAVGTSLASLNVTNVAGSSLTSQGFNAAIASIRNKASA